MNLAATSAAQEHNFVPVGATEHVNSTMPPTPIPMTGPSMPDGSTSVYGPALPVTDAMKPTNPDPLSSCEPHSYLKIQPNVFDNTTWYTWPDTGETEEKYNELKSHTIENLVNNVPIFTIESIIHQADTKLIELEKNDVHPGTDDFTDKLKQIHEYSCSANQLIKNLQTVDDNKKIELQGLIDDVDERYEKMLGGTKPIMKEVVNPAVAAVAAAGLGAISLVHSIATATPCESKSQNNEQNNQWLFPKGYQPKINGPMQSIPLFHLSLWCNQIQTQFERMCSLSNITTTKKIPRLDGLKPPLRWATNKASVFTPKITDITNNSWIHLSSLFFDMTKEEEGMYTLGSEEHTFVDKTRIHSKLQFIYQTETNPTPSAIPSPLNPPKTVQITNENIDYVLKDMLTKYRRIQPTHVCSAASWLYITLSESFVRSLLCLCTQHNIPYRFDPNNPECTTSVSNDIQNVRIQYACIREDFNNQTLFYNVYFYNVINNQNGWFQYKIIDTNRDFPYVTVSFSYMQVSKPPTVTFRCIVDTPNITTVDTHDMDDEHMPSLLSPHTTPATRSTSTTPGAPSTIGTDGPLEAEAEAEEDHPVPLHNKLSTIPVDSSYGDTSEATNTLVNENSPSSNLSDVGAVAAGTLAGVGLTSGLIIAAMHALHGGGKRGTKLDTPAHRWTRRLGSQTGTPVHAKPHSVTRRRIRKQHHTL
jgi:hypothetical protein